MAVLSSRSRSAAEGPSPSTALKRRPSRLLSLFKKRTFIKKVGDMAIFRPARGEKLPPTGNASDRQRSRAITRASAPRDDDDELIFFRCDIYAANGDDFIAAETLCKLMVVEAGGTVMEEYEYIGGFLYTFPANMDVINPLTDNYKTKQGGTIRISPWKPFITKRLDPLRMNPPDIVNTAVPDTDQEKNEDTGLTHDKSKALPSLPAGTKMTRRQSVQDWIRDTTSFLSDSTGEDGNNEAEGDSGRGCIFMTTRMSQHFESANPQSVEAEEETPHKGIVQTACTGQYSTSAEEDNDQALTSAWYEDHDSVDEELALSPRILDPGVELAILDPSLIRSGASCSRMSMLRSGSRASWCEKEVYYPDSNPDTGHEANPGCFANNTVEHVENDLARDDNLDDATTLCGSIGSSERYSGVPATAMAGHKATPTLVRSFGEEMKDLEQRYRNWVPDLTTRSRFAEQLYDAQKEEGV